MSHVHELFGINRKFVAAIKLQFCLILCSFVGIVRKYGLWEICTKWAQSIKIQQNLLCNFFLLVERCFFRCGKTLWISCLGSDIDSVDAFGSDWNCWSGLNVRKLYATMCYTTHRPRRIDETPATNNDTKHGIIGHGRLQFSTR